MEDQMTNRSSYSEDIKINKSMNSQNGSNKVYCKLTILII